MATRTLAGKQKVFDVDMCRIGYGHRTLRILAANATQAKAKALDIAGNFDYSEKSSDYEADSVSVAADQKSESDAAADLPAKVKISYRGLHDKP